MPKRPLRDQYENLVSPNAFLPKQMLYPLYGDGRLAPRRTDRSERVYWGWRKSSSVKTVYSGPVRADNPNQMQVGSEDCAKNRLPMLRENAAHIHAALAWRRSDAGTQRLSIPPIAMAIEIRQLAVDCSARSA